MSSNPFIKKYLVVKGMFTFKSLSEKVIPVKGLNERLREISRILSEDFHIEVYFCKIYGKRWSYVAGNKSIILLKSRYRLNDDFGICSDKLVSDNIMYPGLIEVIKELIDSVET